MFPSFWFKKLIKVLLNPVSWTADTWTWSLCVGCACSVLGLTWYHVVSWAPCLNLIILEYSRHPYKISTARDILIPRYKYHGWKKNSPFWIFNTSFFLCISVMFDLKTCLMWNRRTCKLKCLTWTWLNV